MTCGRGVVGGAGWWCAGCDVIPVEGEEASSAERVCGEGIGDELGAIESGGGPFEEERVDAPGTSLGNGNAPRDEEDDDPPKRRRRGLAPSPSVSVSVSPSL